MDDKSHQPLKAKCDKILAVDGDGKCYVWKVWFLFLCWFVLLQVKSIWVFLRLFVCSFFMASALGEFCVVLWFLLGHQSRTRG